MKRQQEIKLTPSLLAKYKDLQPEPSSDSLKATDHDVI